MSDGSHKYNKLRNPVHFLSFKTFPSQSLLSNQDFLLYKSNNNNRGPSRLTYQNSKSLCFTPKDVAHILLSKPTIVTVYVFLT